MDIINGIKDTPVPTLMLIGGFIFLFLGIATIKKPIVIDVSPSGRKNALILGIALVCISLYFLFSQSTIPANIISETPTVTVAETPTLLSTSILSISSSTVTPTNIPPIALIMPSLQDVLEGQEFYFDIREGETGKDLSGYTLEFTLDGADGRDAQLFFKNCNFDSVYSVPQPISNNIPIQFNPVSDPRRIDEFSSFTCIASVGIKIFNNAQGIKIVSAQLILK